MQKQNYLFVDYLRVTATLCVILIHASADAVSAFAPTARWTSGLLYDGISRFSVPVFLMLSGALLFPRPYTTTPAYLKNRVSRLVLPFLFWSLIYVAHELALQSEPVSPVGILKFLFIRLVNGAEYHLWYVYMIIGLYLFFPILIRWTQRASKREIEAFLGIWLMTCLLNYPVIGNYFPKIDLAYFAGFIGYPVLGHYLMNLIGPDRAKARIGGLLLFLGAEAFTVAGTYFLSVRHQALYPGLFNYLAVNTVAAAAGIFLFYKYSGFREEEMITKAVRFLSKYSYGIYLVHVLVLTYIVKAAAAFVPVTVSPYATVPLIALVCLLVSAAIVALVHRLPLGSKVSG